MRLSEPPREAVFGKGAAVRLSHEPPLY
jgi:hypothetical protein